MKIYCRRIESLLMIALVLFLLLPYAVMANDAAVPGIDFTSLLLQTMDPIAVALAIGATQGIKKLVSKYLSGNACFLAVFNRVLPFVPILVACVAVALLYWGQPVARNLVLGIISGVAAAYGFRTTKVTVFGA